MERASCGEGGVRMTLQVGAVRRAGFVLTFAGGFVMFGSVPSGAQTAANCVAVLVPVADDPETDAIETEPVDLGCYDTYEEAVEVGTAGGTDLPEGSSPSSLTQGLLSASTELETSSVLIGTEYTETNFTASSKSYFADSTCSTGVTWEVSYVTDTWNDDFESGKGFGGCDTNKKFVGSNFAGNVLTCTPNCANYGDLKDEVSSLRWRP
jgi:hypothetical protein